jgi:polysaccharide deacetylase family protein (PEP-CTERM system associated)
MAQRVVHAFTVDVEEWYHPLRFYRDTAAVETPRLRVGMDRLMALLDERGVRGTFFWVGETALVHPALVRSLADAGHEIGCHSMRHDRMVYDLGPDAFRAETQQAIDVLQDISGASVRSYRAPCFSITRRSLWALDVLAELGIDVDSSIFPVRNWRYGIPNWPRQPGPAGRGGEIWEAPLPVRNFGSRTVPSGGGAYFRLYPYGFTAANFRAAEREGRGCVFYVHPWELDPGHPFARIPWKPWATHYAALGRTEPRLRRLLADFRFAPLGSLVPARVRAA